MTVSRTIQLDSYSPDGICDVIAEINE
jgi:hypothetical protein